MRHYKHVYVETLPIDSGQQACNWIQKITNTKSLDFYIQQQWNTFLTIRFNLNFIV